MPERLPTRRLFFALWPNSRVRAEIVRRRSLIEGLSPRCVPDHNLHLTLLFLGNQPAERVGDLLTFADEVSGPGFQMVLDQFGWFAAAKVVWLGGPAPPAAGALVERFAEVVKRTGLRYDARPFHPHVTLYRRVARRPAFPDPAPLVWSVEEVALIESIPSRPYQVLRTWPLTV
ncbi:MAG: RNA 2',3'-cyclic phosphodiesterase [Wenzhouxiangella sp.]|nr:RNA 2',3'-cyclic phosphodiesterase [Wenzhouxiangella sp.]